MSELTAGEKAYLESGGADASALIEENAAPATPEPVAEPVPALVAETPAPEPVELGEEEVPAPDGKSKRRMVDSRALKEERKKRQELEAELNRFRENYSRVDERLKLLTDVVSQPDPAPAPAVEETDVPIDPEQDIFGAYKQQQKQLSKLMETIESLRAGQTEMRQETEAERQTSAMVSAYRQDAAAFTSKQPDFTDAYNFLLSKRSEQLKFMGYTDDDIRTTLYNEEMGLAQRALGLKQSPSEYIYNLSKSMGYAPKTAAPAPVPTPAPAPVPSVTAEIDRIKAGQASSKSLSSGAGAAGEELSLELLANMPEKEFAKFMENPANRTRVEIALGRRAA